MCEWFANIWYRIARHTLAPNSTNNQIRGGFHCQLFNIWNANYYLWTLTCALAFSHFHPKSAFCVRVRTIHNIEWIKHYLKRKYRLNAIEASCTQLLHNLNDIAFNFNVSESACVGGYMFVYVHERARQCMCVKASNRLAQPEHTTGMERKWGSRASKQACCTTATQIPLAIY